MAFSLYLKLDGIKGDSEAKGHEGEIELQGCSFEVSNKVPLAMGAGAVKASFQDIRITKKSDSASSQLFLHCCNAKHLPTAMISVVASTGESTSFTLKMKELTITSYEVGLSANAPAEAITLSYKAIEIDYKKQDPTGGVHSTTQGEWDITTNLIV